MEMDKMPEILRVMGVAKWLRITPGESSFIVLNANQNDVNGDPPQFLSCTIFIYL